jgi:uncharacterized protein involved in exopolysaccharide biosynthesis
MTQGNAYDTPKREILVFYYKYRRRLVLSFVLPFIASIALSFVPTPKYEATGTLVVRLGSEYVYQPEIGAGSNGPASPIPFDRDQIYKAEVAILASHDLHQEVVETIGLDQMYPQRNGQENRVLRAVRDWILARLDKWYPEDDETMPEYIQNLRVALAGYESDTRLSEDERAKRRLDMAVERFDKKLNIILGKESAVIDVSFQHADRDIAVQALDTLFKLYLEKRKQLYLESRGALAKDEAEATRRKASSAQAAVENFKREHQIYSLPDQRTQLLGQREEVRKQMATVANPALEDRLNDITRQLDALDALERQYDALQHDVQVTNDEYTLYIHKLDEAQAYDNLERARAGSVRIIQPPAASPEPKRLQGMIILIGFVLSLIATVLVAAITEFSRSGFLTPERIERNLGLPILGAIPLRK